MRFIDDNRAQFGVEPIIGVLATTSAKIALSTYYAHKSRPESARSIRDKQITRALRRIFEDNYSCYGARKLWAEINREAHASATLPAAPSNASWPPTAWRVSARKKKPSTRSADAGECPVDLVERDFAVTAPNMLWVADITYIPTRVGWVYAAFVLDAYSREIVGWQVTNHLRASLARDALDMALSARLRDGEDVSGLIHHNDRLNPPYTLPMRSRTPADSWESGSRWARSAAVLITPWRSPSTPR
ncbi:DDE-type integrase/transposase/recombinase [Corynebacterium suedekumii]|nr:DDE-type integrase/transposase/recombinase [Corynebacterium suedekumii]